MKQPIELFLEANNDPDVRVARHDADNKLFTVILCREMLERAKTDEQRDLLTTKFIKALGECTQYFNLYVDIRDSVYLRLLTLEGYVFEEERQSHEEGWEQDMYSVSRGRQGHSRDNVDGPRIRTEL